MGAAAQAVRPTLLPLQDMFKAISSPSGYLSELDGPDPNCSSCPSARNTSDVMPAIGSYSSLKVDTSESGSKPRKSHASKSRKRFFKAKKPSSLRSSKSFAVAYWFKSFAALLLLHFLVGTLEFEPLGKEATWVNLLSLVTLVGALFVFIDLYREKRTSAQAVGVTVALVLRWAASLFATEFVYGYFLGPGDYGLRADLALCRDQSPWIWITYAVLPVSGTIGCSAYLFYRSQRQVRFLN